MKIEPKTLSVMKNFSSINPSLLFKAGNVLSTVSPTRSVLAIARIDQTFEQQFAIFDLSRFIGVMSLFDNPDLEFGEKAVRMKSDGRELEYRYADVNTIIVAPDKKLVLPSVDVEFILTAVHLADIQRALGALGMPEIAVVGDREDLWLQVTDSKNLHGDSFRIKVGKTDKKFHLVFKAENLKLIQQDYSVQITSKGMSQFKGNTVIEVEYWIALEAKASKFEA
jgi:hypothetical protein